MPVNPLVQKYLSLQPQQNRQLTPQEQIAIQQQNRAIANNVQQGIQNEFQAPVVGSGANTNPNQIYQNPDNYEKLRQKFASDLTDKQNAREDAQNAANTEYAKSIGGQEIIDPDTGEKMHVISKDALQAISDKQHSKDSMKKRPSSEE
jgi:hypothetical protein